MKIQEIYKNNIVQKMMDINPQFYLFQKEIEKWEEVDWVLWGDIVKGFAKLKRIIA